MLKIIDGLVTVLSLTWKSPYLKKMVFILRWGPEYYKYKVIGAVGSLIQAIPALCNRDVWLVLNTSILA